MSNPISFNNDIDMSNNNLTAYSLSVTNFNYDGAGIPVSKVVGAVDAALSASPRSIASLGTHCEEARQQSISEQLQRHTSTI